jgi:hypothetical protein
VGARQAFPAPGSSSGAGANPIGKAFKRFRNGAGDSLAFFYQSTTHLPGV